ncbi:MAG TPA: MBL fold metallo-hydrolase [Vicinamibacterales bacterium]|nr:MBL fold metallo-hydrolase [Vicinamibacterales bacterium]
MRLASAAVSAAVIAAGAATLAAAPAAAQPVRVLDLGHGIYEAIGVAVGTGGRGAGAPGSNPDRVVAVPASNTFLVTTSAGNVVIDTSLAAVAPAHKQALAAKSSAPVKAIVLTHAHGDHTGGVRIWREPGTEIIAQRNHAAFARYQRTLAGFFGRRNAEQFGLGATPAAAAAAVAFAPTRTFDERDTLTVGDVEFDLIHTPGETPDHLTVWIPQFKTAFIGDNYYESFPNLYTLRGTMPRWALDYVESLDTVLALQPDLVLPSHGQPIRGRDEIKRRLTQYRDAIRFVHDATVKGMNEGKDVFTLMREIRLPPALDVGESYGKLTWSIRGIYEGYAGWFDGNPSTMYGDRSQSYKDVATLAGGADAVASRARAVAADDPARALQLTDIALAAEPGSRAALEARLAALQALDRNSTNSNERGWLQAGIRDVQSKLK